MKRRAPTARQLETMRFINKLDRWASEPLDPTKGRILGAGGCSHPANVRVHDSLVRRGWIYRMDSEEKNGSVQLWHLTPEGKLQLQIYGMED